MILVKICGITNQEDAEAVAEAGADALGFNFWRGSARFVQRQIALKIVLKVPLNVLKVGVFVDSSAAEMDEVAHETGLDVVQLHGSPAGVPRTRFWQAVAAGSAGWRETMEHSMAESFLLDAPAGAERGGTGRVFDWSLASGLPYRIILAGGLSAENVAEAVTRARPWGVDACSRLEREPGRKDWKKVKAFIDAVKATGL
jgi:phosphoribosylanthranilate isomerase